MVFAVFLDLSIRNHDAHIPITPVSTGMYTVGFTKRNIVGERVAIFILFEKNQFKKVYVNEINI